MNLINPYIYVVAAPDFTSYSNSGGSGNRTASITTGSSGGFLIGTTSILVDGNLTSTGLYFGVSASVGAFFSFDFVASRVIDQIRWYQSAPTVHGVWKMQGSHDNSTYTDLGSSFSLGNADSAISTHTCTNSTAYRYYRLTKVSGADSGGPWLYEIEFKISSPAVTAYTNANGQGDRTGTITLAQASQINGAPGMVSTSLMINGVTNTGLAYFNTYPAYMYDGWWLSFDFGSAQVIDEFKWYQQTTASHGTWKVQGSIDNSTWVDVGSTFTLGGATIQTVTAISSNIISYRYYRIYLNTGPSSNAPYLYEIEFKIAAPQ